MSQPRKRADFSVNATFVVLQESGLWGREEIFNMKATGPGLPVIDLLI